MKVDAHEADGHQALKAIHERGIVHHDISYSNVLFDPVDGVTVIDFELALMRE